MDLAIALGVSDMTVRRDIEKLAADGHLVRVLGGAMSTAGSRPDFGARAGQAATSKRAIARRAASLLPAGTVGLDSGTTVAMLAPLLAPGTCIVTHSAPVIEIAEARADVDLIVTGGVYQRSTRSLVGPAALHALEGLALDAAVLSVAGIDDGWLLGGDALDAAVKRALVTAARRVVVVADASKIGARAPIRIAPLTAVDDVVTDGGGAAALDPGEQASFRVAIADDALVE